MHINLSTLQFNLIGSFYRFNYLDRINILLIKQLLDHNHQTILDHIKWPRKCLLHVGAPTFPPLKNKPAECYHLILAKEANNIKIKKKKKKNIH